MKNFGILHASTPSSPSDAITSLHEITFPYQPQSEFLSGSLSSERPATDLFLDLTLVIPAPIAKIHEGA